MAELIPLFFVIVYITPFCVAAARDHHSTVPILLVNLFFGWTGIGWLVCLLWAAFGPAQTAQSRARDARRYAPRTGGGKPALPRIMHNFTD